MLTALLQVFLGALFISSVYWGDVMYTPPMPKEVRGFNVHFPTPAPGCQSAARIPC